MADLSAPGVNSVEASTTHRGHLTRWRRLALVVALGLSAACGSPRCRARLHWQGKGETFRVYGCPTPDCARRRLVSTVAAADACRGEECEAIVRVAEPWIAVAAVAPGNEAMSAPRPGCRPGPK